MSGFQFERECRELCANYLRLEDPRTVREIGLELRLEAPVGDLTLRGIIDDLDTLSRMQRVHQAR